MVWCWTKYGRLCNYAASDLSAFVTGTTVHADGGSLAAGGWYRTERGSWTNRPLTWTRPVSPWWKKPSTSTSVSGKRLSFG